MTGEELRTHNLEHLFETCPKREITNNDLLVVFSDLHMGDGSRKDDFRHNGDIFCSVLEKFYGRQNYHLILNGDVEDLQRFSMRRIVHRWGQVYRAFATIAERGGLTRIVGNHDLEWLEGGPEVSLLAAFGRDRWPNTFTEDAQEALRLLCKSGDIFIFHGHQTSYWYQNHNNVARLLLRYIANPLHISSPTVAADSLKRFKIERRTYQFASEHKILAFIGHTHRPLFESMTKSDSLLFEIELLCRQYHDSEQQHDLENRVAELKTELEEIRRQEEFNRSHSSLYRENLLVPSLFNSGSALGKRGMTCLEIDSGVLRLVYWYDSARKHRHRRFHDHSPEILPGTPYRRIIIKEDKLPYIFSRVRLLA